MYIANLVGPGAPGPVSFIFLQNSIGTLRTLEDGEGEKIENKTNLSNMSYLRTYHALVLSTITGSSNRVTRSREKAEVGKKTADGRHRYQWDAPRGFEHGSSVSEKNHKVLQETHDLSVATVDIILSIRNSTSIQALRSAFQS